MKHSIWFMPPNSLKYETIINKLAQKYHSPKFKPHITLIGDITDRDVFKKTQELIKKLKPLKIKINKVTFMNDYYRCVLALIEQTHEIMGAAKLARQIFTEYNKREYIPHLSLLYGVFSKEIKEKIVKNIKIKDEFMADKLFVATAGDIPEEWEVVKEYSLII